MSVTSHLKKKNYKMPHKKWSVEVHFNILFTDQSMPVNNPDCC